MAEAVRASLARTKRRRRALAAEAVSQLALGGDREQLMNRAGVASEAVGGLASSVVVATIASGAALAMAGAVSGAVMA